MTPQERDLIMQLLQRLKQTGGQPKDAEAEALIRGAVAEQPDAPYYLVQTVLIQDMALSTAQARIAELERRAEAAQSQPAQPTSFLGGLFAGGRAASQPGPAAQPGAPPPGPWGRHAPPQAPAAGPWGQPAAPMAGGMMPGAGGMMQPMVQGGSGGFLRQAAATAAGIAGGALLFEGIQSMFGHHAGGILGNAAAQPGLSETVVNNYYGNDAASGGTPDLQTASYEPGGGADQGNWDQGNGDQGGGTDYANDPGYDSSQDIASDQDFGGDDLGSNDDFA